VHPLTRVLALEFGPLGVSLNAIAPGTTASERVVAVRTKEQFDEIASMTALSRIGEVLDLANRILFLAAPESGYLTGNGGRAML
jgi:NAD(P)-dependent dehydrogenase (short-subunit alcohol dehydrogenase family)